MERSSDHGAHRLLHRLTNDADSTTLAESANHRRRSVRSSVTEGKTDQSVAALGKRPRSRRAGLRRHSVDQRNKMAAVAAEPGAAVPTTTRSENPPEPGPYSPGHHEVTAAPSGGPEPGPGGNPESGESGEGRHVGPEQEPGAGPVLPGTDRTTEGQLDRSGTAEDVPDRTATTGLSDLPTDCSGSERVFPGLPNSDGTSNYRTIPLDPQPPAVFLHSVPDPAPVSEAGLSLAEPAEPTELDRCYTVLEQQNLGLGPTEESVLDGDPEPGSRFCKNSADPKHEDSSGSEPSSVLDLSPGTEVRVSLEHVIDDALVVSFRLGEQVFSGVLMDVSRR